jgi:RNA polymerase sigma-70 factor (ECF subfamily)
VTSAGSGSAEQGLLDAARRGDEGAYRRVVEPHRPELLAHCYRMLGSIHDAEDALQEAMLRAWRGLPRFEGRSSVRSWLYRIATNACLDAIARRPSRVLPIGYGPAADPHDGPGEPLTGSTWLEPFPEERVGEEAGYASPEARYERRESVELAFVAALQRLPARQRAVLILREVLGFSALEVAETLESTTASVNSAMQRARRTVEEGRPGDSQQATMRALGDGRLREVAGRFVDAWERGDVNAIVALLAEDATFAMPPFPTWYRGPRDIAVFIAGHALGERWRLVPARASGQLAFGKYQRDPEGGGHRAVALDVLTLRDGEIAGLTAFVTPRVAPVYEVPDWVATFGMPERLRPG